MAAGIPAHLNAGFSRVRVLLASVASARLFGKALRFWLSLGVVVAAITSSVATFLILNGLTSVYPTSEVVLTTLGINAAFVIFIIGIIGYQVAQLLKARKRQAGAGLHFRIAAVFSFVALFPAVLLAIFATVSIDRTFDTFFSTRVKSIVNNTVEVAQSYLQESGQVIRSDLVDVAREVEIGAALFTDNKAAFERLFSSAVSLRALPAAFIIDSKGQLLAASSTDGPRYKAPPPADIARAAEGRIVPLSWDLANGVAAIKKLNGFEDAFIYAVRPVNPNVFRLLQRTQQNIFHFQKLEMARGQYQFVFALMYVLLAVTLLTSAIWTGLVFANRLVMPIRKLIGAAQEVSQGNLNVQFEDGFARDDIGRLGQTFKQMTVDLKTQRDDIMNANSELDERRRFIEAVLSGVTAGVIGVDPAGCIKLINRSGLELLALSDDTEIIGKPLVEAVPEFGEVIEKGRRQSRTKPVHGQITIVRETGERNFAVQVTREKDDQADFGVVLTFDDVTELTVAQRTSAWADVARRIAHEIKNPLTPIQLSAERIRRKYGASITQDREIFDKCTETIIRHVGDIGRMVDEFSSFARMPQAVFEEQDIREVVREAVILFQMSRSDIEYKLDMPKEKLVALCDRRLLTQAVTNLVKNASEAVEAYRAANPESGKGRVMTKLRLLDHRFVIEVVDTGVGLPKENRHRLVEPYVTTRQKGTGLGLAIVQRITEQHGGVLELADAPATEDCDHGARISMTIPVSHGVERTEKDEARPNGKAELVLADSHSQS
ncbi:sensor histidine kinase NtrY-like [Rhodomicrobium lacus]|uniref:sensor histidine kinase NtrY-like n=1 Tax=Rhodomicrobium lacus TaxID=2498452 RepID=UPI0026E33DC4|nr:PAS domain-containing sensor histidine kinase [Rhodomicrobium lacus]WKW51448.1 PAS domain-containing sensor histidine kinase [Rhodomicrobium lacus]